MRRKKHDNVEWLEFNLLANIPKLRHGVFLRRGGFSTAPFASLNMSNLDDDKIAVEKNRQAVMTILGVNTLHYAKQCHGDEIYECAADRIGCIPSCDALSTSQTGVPLMIMHADCQAAIFYDPRKHVLANVHSGWRGSVQNIYAKTVDFMKKKYQSLPQDILVCISPSLGPEDAEFINYRKELPEHFWKYQIKPNYFDFWEISKMQLIHCGVLPQHIEIARISNYAHPEDYFSYRRDSRTGRNATIALLIE